MVIVKVGVRKSLQPLFLKRRIDNMEAYRMYFDEDTKSFIAEKQPRRFKDKYSVTSTDFEAYFIDCESAMKAAEDRNQHLSCIRYCKDCGKKFWLSEDEEQWFKDRDLKAPVRCMSCRGAKRRRKRG